MNVLNELRFCRLFESYISARGVGPRREIFDQLLEFDPLDILLVGHQQFFEHGNDDRLRLVESLLIEKLRTAEG
jgi:hypothetical protein